MEKFEQQTLSGKKQALKNLTDWARDFGDGGGVERVGRGGEQPKYY